MGRIVRVRAQRAEDDGSHGRQDPEHDMKKADRLVRMRRDYSDTLLADPQDPGSQKRNF